MTPFTENSPIEDPNPEDILFNEGRDETKELARRSAAKRVFRLAHQLVAWGLAAQSILPGIESVLTRRGPGPQDEERVEQIDPAIAKNEDNLRYLRSIYGEAAVKYVAPDSNFFKAKDFYDQLPTAIYRGREEGVNFRPEVGKDLGLSGDELGQLFVDSYPDGLVNAEVNIIILEPGKIDTTSSEKLSGFKGQLLGEVVKSAYGSSEYLYEEKIEAVAETHAHEVGHTIDWIRDVNRPVQEKIELWRKVSERYLYGEKKYRSGYVESIRLDDPSREINHKVTEYWAEICGQYFQHPGGLKRGHPQDFELVDKWVKKTNPEFNEFEAARDRQGLVAKKRLARELKNLPAGLQENLENLRQVWAVRYIKEGPDKYGYFNVQTADLDEVERLCLAEGLKKDGARDLRLAYALWGSFEYTGYHDYQP